MSRCSNIAALQSSLDNLVGDGEQLIGSWLCEPLSVTEPPQPDRGLELASDFSLAFLVLLQQLAPEERAVFLRRDVFEYKYADIAAALSKTQAACRQLLHRARGAGPWGTPSLWGQWRNTLALAHRFLEAMHTADQDSLMALFAEDATLISDSGGKVRAVVNAIHGGDRIARLLIGVARKGAGIWTEELMLINGELGIVTYLDGLPAAVLCFEIDAAHIRSVYRILNPEKLKNIPACAEN